MNFLIHNMCRLPSSDGTWMIVRGGMGSVTSALATAARRAGAVIETSRPVASIEVERGAVRSVVTTDGARYEAETVVAGTDPFRLVDLVGREGWSPSFLSQVDGWRRDGTTLKVNLALRDLPRFSCLPEPIGQHQATIHILPEPDVRARIDAAFADVAAGRLPREPTIEWYIHSTVDPTLSDARGRHSAALFVQWVPYALAGTTWEAEEQAYAEHLLSICDRFAPGTSDLVDDMFILHPPRIESYFGMTRGHIHHVDNTFGFADRMPYATEIAGLYACGAGCHPGGSVIGASGRNAAHRVLRDLGRDVRGAR
jgi:phytoene dehydrogenase-like protein